MMNSFYAKLAYSGMVKNKKTYLPYIITCIGMVMIYYILTALSYNSLVWEMGGGRSLGTILGFGKFVVAVFALIFLFYTNSFLIRRRNMEFGLYNILGMGKKKLRKIIVSESLILYLISISAGLILGIIFYKLAELGLIRAIRENISFSFSVSSRAMIESIGIFAVIFALIMLKSLIQIGRLNTVDMINSEKTGEKKPKANWLITVIGMVLLIGAYYMAVSIKKPLDAMNMFFVAVIMVIVATYLIFISGSVTLCRMLQKNKKYYYNKKHFVSVSSMAYRMKRNGAGLASICILSTMVLVIASSTVCMYAGIDDGLRKEYPRDNHIQYSSEEKECREIIEKELRNEKLNVKNMLNYRQIFQYGNTFGNTITLSKSSMNNDYRSVYVVPLSDYNEMTGENLTLKDNEAYYFTLNGSSIEDKVLKLENEDQNQLKIKGQVDDFMPDRNLKQNDTIYVIVKDITIFHMPVYENYLFDSDSSDEIQIREMNKLTNKLSEYGTVSVDFVAEEREEFISIYGGLFFIGIMLSIAFIIATVLIIYYKQISEGYGDQPRYEIMQKIGMKKIDIKKSINSQILTLFFLPLAMAGLHLAFAFPLLWKILLLMDVDNLNLEIISMVIAYVIFGVMYTVVYKITSNSYYKIVSN